jgi:hypothetical protein
MEDERPDDAITEDLDDPSPTQERTDEELKERRGWETEDSPHEGEEGQAEEPA